MPLFPFRNIPLHLGLLLVFFHAYNGVSAQKAVEAIPFDIPPVIDGWLNEEVWKTATPVTGFIQREPNTGQAFSERTEVYIGYDQHNLYIGFRCHGDPDKITAKELARDVSLQYDDRVQVILDTYLDKRNAYWFQIGPRGSIGDAIVSENGTAFNKAWDGLWTGRAKIH
ncbi:MAG: carbohydrate binding family 9 domain-containing protein, partial [Bacteroidales bacterium]|nr:carbohydrate binding family 9 domain-containing protein [Bacteroidales bacterium]